jgi:crotonobetainyl-CoA:carnitine CoA-transferase CaiB-like acyl-CoA transferase
VDLASPGGALDGIRVLDLGLLVQGPQAAQLLRDLGAEVIKVELPGLGDQARWIPISLQDLRAPYFVGCNRGKRSITLDLRSEAGRGVFLRLADVADVVISNFLPGTMERWGLGYEELAKRNPRIVYGTGSAFGSQGPDANRKGADLAGQAAGGLISSTGNGPQDVTPVGVTIADHIGSQNLAAGILAALLARERSGRGQQVEVSLLGGLIYAQASGHIAIVGVPADRRDAFFETVRRPELARDERFHGLLFTPENRETLFELLAETFRTRRTAEWEQILGEAGLRYAAVRDYLEVSEDEAAFENGYLQRVEHPEWGTVAMVGCPIQLSGTPAKPGAVAPELGQHTEEILLELGLAWDEIHRLREAGVL